MVILAIDTALGAVAACAYDAQTDKVLASERVELQRGHAEALVPLIERLAADLPGRFESIDQIAVTIGPGSFTGIRVGVACARSLGTACSVDVIGVSTLAAFAAPLVGRGDSQVACVIDARHGNVYFECYDSGGAIIHEAASLPVREAASLLGDSPTILAGPGASLVAIEAWSQGRKVEVGGETVSPDIAYVARLAAVAEPSDALPQPFYLRAADTSPPAPSLALAPT